MERRARNLTGATMGAVALAATYALLVLTDQTSDGRLHLYPIITALLFYFAGDLIAMIWFRLLAGQLASYIRRLEAQQHSETGHRNSTGQSDVEESSNAAKFGEHDDVEIIKPGTER
jgi:hypothetical protein